jgi:ferric-dicitrate binding protein FerR (iron transport regulator)
MDDRDPRLLRLLHGELSAAAEERLRRDLAGDPELRQRLERLSAVWRGLELPPAALPPLGFAGRLQARLPAVRPVSWRLAPSWARGAAAAALAAGLAVGVGLGSWRSPPEEPLTLLAEDLALADDYWLLLAEEGAGEGPGGAGS